MRTIRGWAAAAALAAAGCTGKYDMAPVTGTVMTCQGKPAEGGEVFFQPADDPGATGRPAGHAGWASSGVVGPDGRFTLTAIDAKAGAGALVGRHTVVFQMPRTVRPKVTTTERDGAPPEVVKALEESYAKTPIYPAIPCSDKIAPAEVVVKAGEANTFEFTLPPK